MARPRKESPDLKDERDIALFEEYHKVMRSYGINAVKIAKSCFYAEAAKKFYITEATARIIIQKMLRKRTKLGVERTQNVPK